MSILLWVALVLVSALNAYAMQFTAATRSMGKALANTSTGRGVQDAITPPWLTTVAIFGYLVGVVVLALIWWFLGWLALVAALAVAFVLTGLLSGIFSAAARAHFDRMILTSMMSRYADFIRDHDTLRASAMKDLLTKAGFDPDTVT